ncbi:TPA: aminoglycoside phosphotransferase family protein [Candidatus Poribacteria bacterium]|nr:aminoglycoside phosphotransferase family protein [Candidatus Poribacteria bacterium]
MSSDIYEYEDGEYEAVKEALTRIFSNKYKRDVRITSFLREEIRNWERSVVSRLYLQLDSCDETTVIVKQKNPNEFGAPDWYGVTGEDFIVAQEMIARILSGKRIAPELYGTVCDVEKRRYWLFTEDLGKNLVRSGDWENEEMKHCLGFVETLAKIHRLFADKEEELQALGGLRGTPADPDSRNRAKRGWRDIYESALEKAPDNIETMVQTGKFPWLNEMATDFAAIMEPCRPIIDPVVSQPFVFTHGDKSPGENMIIGREGEDAIYYFIDWEDVTCVPVLEDLAGFLGYGREETEELALVERYWECVQGSPLVSSEKEECLMMYKYSKLMCSIRCVHGHSVHLVQEQFLDGLGVWRDGVIRRAVPVAIKLAKELQMLGLSSFLG